VVLACDVEQDHLTHGLVASIEPGLYIRWQLQVKPSIVQVLDDLAHLYPGKAAPGMQVQLHYQGRLPESLPMLFWEIIEAVFSGQVKVHLALSAALVDPAMDWCGCRRNHQD